MDTRVIKLYWAVFRKSDTGSVSLSDCVTSSKPIFTSRFKYCSFSSPGLCDSGLDGRFCVEKVLAAMIIYFSAVVTERFYQVSLPLARR